MHGPLGGWKELRRGSVRRAAKVDANHGEVVNALRAVGCSVLSLAAVGNGCPDLLVCVPWNRRLHLIEVKDGSRPPSERKLTDDQVKFHASWKGPIHVVMNVEQALAVVHCGKVEAQCQTEE